MFVSFNVPDFDRVLTAFFQGPPASTLFLPTRTTARALPSSRAPCHLTPTLVTKELVLEKTSSLVVIIQR